MGKVGFEISQGRPRHELGRQIALFVTGEDANDFRFIIACVKRRSEMAAAGKAAVLKPIRQGRTIEMQREKILKIMEREVKIWDAARLGCVVFSTFLVVSMIKVKVSPDFNGGFAVGLPGFVILAPQLFEATAFCDSLFGRYEAQGRFKHSIWHSLSVQKALQTLEVGSLGFSFANNDVARCRHRQRAGCGTPA